MCCIDKRFGKLHDSLFIRLIAGVGMHMDRLTVWSLGLVCSTLILAPELIHAQFVDPQNVLLQNVQIVDPAKAGEPVRINILVQDNELKIVSEDLIQVDGQVVVVDARSGFLLGKLEIGKPPSFIILDKNPGDDIEVLLDTKAHTIFAVHDGRLLRNSLYAGDEAEKAKMPTEGGWRAYTPPPMALPLTYLDKTKWNRWESKAVSGIFLAAVVLDRQQMLSQDDGSEQQFGDLGIYDGGEIRGLRFGAVGTINFKKPWVYTVFGATNAFDKGFEITDRIRSPFLTTDWIFQYSRKLISASAIRKNRFRWNASCP